VKSGLPAIVLAAGASRRLGQPKQLLTIGGETLMSRAIRLALMAGASPVFAVLGAHYDRVRELVKSSQAMPVLNESWNEGIASSIHAGLRALDEILPTSAGVLILACDQPRLTGQHLREMLETFAAQANPAIVASAYAGALGVPAAFPRLAFPYLFALTGDKGARTLLLHAPCPLVALEFAGGDVDIDSPNDLNFLE
jgi:CTP:molybdopterin cytidylyltransferase MocA